MQTSVRREAREHGVVLWKHDNSRGENKEAPRTRRTLRWNFAARYATSFSRSVHAVEFMRESRKQALLLAVFIPNAASGAETRGRKEAVYRAWPTESDN